MIPCKRCGDEFETGPEVGEHVKQEHSKESATAKGKDVVYRCFACPVPSPSIQELIRHLGGHPHDKQAAYEENLRWMAEAGFTEPVVDDKGVVGYRRPA